MAGNILAIFLIVGGIVLIVTCVMTMVMRRGSITLEKIGLTLGMGISVFGLWLQIRPPSVHEAHEVGGVELTGYCQSKGFQRASYPQDVERVKDWACVGPGNRATTIASGGFLSWNDACEFEYGGGAYAVNADPLDLPFGVTCLK
ncbi:hypothetical protein OG373_19315 [Streptomyces avidinii]|uniref:hypothetical protein n=1 Tax=Streptomyces avidinii TaxID=1895 RepID=UPI003865F6B8|nr:hypothetical protein OG373_19315 [Streptomyces avidinii]